MAVCDTVLIERELPQGVQLTHSSEKPVISVSEVAWLLPWDYSLLYLRYKVLSDAFVFLHL